MSEFKYITMEDARTAKGLSMKEAAKELKISIKSLTALEKNSFNIDDRTYSQMAELYGVGMDKLYCGPVEAETEAIEMKKQKSNLDLASKLTDIASQLSLIENYFSCVLLEESACDQGLVWRSLFIEKGVDNANETIRILKEQVEETSNALMDREP